MTRSVCFTRVARSYRSELVDPPMEKLENAVSISFDRDPDALIEAYYGALRDFLNESALEVERGDRRLVLRLAAFDPADLEYVFVGMDAQALQAVNDGVLPKLEREVDQDDSYLGLDGVCILTSASIRPDSIDSHVSNK